LPTRQLAGSTVIVAPAVVTDVGLGVHPTAGGAVVVVVGNVLKAAVKLTGNVAISLFESWNTIAHDTPSFTCTCVGGHG